MYNKEYILENELYEGDSNPALRYSYNGKKFIIYSGYSWIEDILYFRIFDISKYGTEVYLKDAIRINMLKPEYMYQIDNPLSKEEKVNLISILQKEALDAIGNPTMGETNWKYLIRNTNEFMGYNYPLDLSIPDYTKLPGGD